MPFLMFARVLFFAALSMISYLAVAPLDAVVLSTGWDKLNHLIAFAVLILLLDYAYPRFQFWPGQIVTLLCYGFLLELAQAFIPYREFSLLDLLADALGIAFYGLCRPCLLRFRPIAGQ